MCGVPDPGAPCVHQSQRLHLQGHELATKGPCRRHLCPLLSSRCVWLQPATIPISRRLQIGHHKSSAVSAAFLEKASPLRGLEESYQAFRNENESGMLKHLGEYLGNMFHYSICKLHLQLEHTRVFTRGIYCWR